MSHDSLHLYIGGERIGAGSRDTLPVHDPATGGEIGRLPVATDADLDAALDAAARAFAGWSRTTAFERGRILRRAAQLLRERADHIGELLTREEGIQLGYAKAEVLWSADILDWCAEEARRAYGRVIPSSVPGLRQVQHRFPVGPVAQFTPWNAPALMPARKIGEALAAGCTVIIKAAEETPACALEVVRALVDAGLPAGVLNAVFGVPAQISSHLIASPVIRKASFTGSVEVGRQLGRLAGEHGKPITLELGGHAPVLVFDDADIDKAVELSAAMKAWNAGQLCGSPTRFLVQQGVFDDFVARFVSHYGALKLGDGRDADTAMGPLANPRRVVAIERFVADARTHGARVLCGGERLERGGYFFAPTVLSDTNHDCMIMNREPFGPICTMVPFEAPDDAIAEANRLGFGLAAYAFTRSASTAHELTERLECGILGLNTFAVVSPETPFGGVKDSGYGAEGGAEGMQSYLVNKYVAGMPE